MLAGPPSELARNSSAASPQQKRRRNGTLPAGLLFLALLVAGLLGTGRQSMTNCRSAVSAQQPSSVVLDGISISYTDSGGSGPVVLCLHAIGHGARDFEDLSPRFGPQYRVIALDFPNHGNSGVDSQPASATRYTEILTQFIENLHLPSVVLLGNSIGGAVSIRYASLPNASRPLCCAIVADAVLPVLWARSLSVPSYNSSQQAAAEPSGFLGPSTATRFSV